MKTTATTLLTFFALIFFGWINAQTLNGKTTKISVDGTSPMHDWTMTASAATFTGKLTGNTLTNVKFIMPVKNLKSAKGKMMDNKAYEALKADKNPNITFTANSINVGKSNVAGKLTIAGVTRDITLPVSVVKNGSSYQITGTEQLKLSDFGMARPGFMGVKTGDAITVSVNITAN